MTNTQTPQDKYITVNGLKLHYLDWGGESPNVVLLVPGIGGNAHNWTPFARRICKDYRVLALEQRGHGDSEHSRDGYAVTSFASDLHDFITALRIAPVDYIASSLGARTGLVCAAQHPGDFKRFIILDGGPETPKPFAKHFTSRPYSFPSEEAATQHFRESTPGYDDDFYRRLAKSMTRKNWVGQLVWKLDPEVAWIPAIASEQEASFIWEQLPKITCPVLVIHPEHGDISSLETAKRIASLAPRAKLAYVEGGRHALAQQRPEEFERLVRNFLQS